MTSLALFISQSVWKLKLHLYTSQNKKERKKEMPHVNVLKIMYNFEALEFRLLFKFYCLPLQNYRGSYVRNCQRFPRSAILRKYDEDWNAHVCHLLLGMARVLVSSTRLRSVIDAQSHFVFRKGPLSEWDLAQFFVYFDQPQFERLSRSCGD